MITQNKKKIFSFFLVLFVGSGVFFLAPNAHATVSKWAGEVIGGLIGWIISAFGLILVLIMKALVLVAQYSNFIGSPAVSNGWKMMRDICNMFFVLILLIIAFATILKIENYSYKKWLPKLILMAILINFSKTICGLLIDFAQVVMLTFVNAFKDIAAGNLITNLGITEILKLAETDDTIGFWQIVGSYVLGLIYILIALVVITTMLAMLVMRIVMIWIYVVLSPAAYLMSAFPGGQKYASQWWSEFTKNLIVGPVLAFFIWLSFVSLQAQDINTDFKVTDATVSVATTNELRLKGPGTSSITGSNASTPEVFIRFIIAIGMLIGGLKISQEIGGAAGSMAGKGMAKIQQGAAFAGNAAGKAALWTAKRPLKTASWANDRFLQNKGIADLNLVRVRKEWIKRREDKKEQKYTQGKVKAGQRIDEGGTLKGAFALSALGEDSYDHLMTWRGMKQTVKGGKRMNAAREKIKDSPGFEQAKFESDYADLEKPEEKSKKRAELRQRDTEIHSNINTADEKIKNFDEDIKTTFDPAMRKKLESSREKVKEERAGLLKEKYRNGDKLAYAQQNSRREYTQEDKDAAKDKVETFQRRIENNVPMTNYNTKMAEQAGIQKEHAKLSLTSDPDELLRLLKSALQTKDTAKASAVMIKLTKDGNDNDITRVLDKEGDTSWLGLQRVMKDIANPQSKNYGGFSQQQAFSLGASLSELNKSVNHWEAVGGFKMENGQWKETTEEEAAEISLSESGKKDPQDLTKSGNRLAFGKYVKGKFQLTASGVVRLKTIASDGNLKNVEGRQNENAAKNILPEITDIDENGKRILKQQYEGHLSQAFVEAMEKRLGNISSSDPLEELKKVKDIKFT